MNTLPLVRGWGICRSGNVDSHNVGGIQLGTIEVILQDPAVLHQRPIRGVAVRNRPLKVTNVLVGLQVANS